MRFPGRYFVYPKDGSSMLLRNVDTYLWWVISWKEYGRERSGRNRDTITAFACSDWGKPRKTSVTIAGAPDKIRTQHLPHSDLELTRSVNWHLASRHNDPELCTGRCKHWLIWLRSFGTFLTHIITAKCPAYLLLLYLITVIIFRWI
jgi:hypothetical protein